MPALSDKRYRPLLSTTCKSVKDEINLTKGWEIVVERIPLEHVNSRWGLHLVSLPDSSHVSTISFPPFSGWRELEGRIPTRQCRLDHVYIGRRRVVLFQGAAENYA
ncbi:unnamed protein product, partial [Vitis vinifera]|uniref:Uncharacterized protein n=1 Tax=Vitis vinifera TaxID=29760 RepID=D7SM85_VITVI